MRRTRGFTLIELLVVVAIIALLIAILIPSLANARRLAKTTACLANVHALSQAAMVYGSIENNYVVPGAMVYTGGTDLGFFALIVNKCLPSPNLVPPPGFSQTNWASYPALSMRSPFICPLTPSLDVTQSANGGLNQTQDGYWQNTSQFYDNTLKLLSSPAGANGTNALILQASYGINGTTAGTGSQLPCLDLPANKRRLTDIKAASSLAFMYDGSTVNAYSVINWRIVGRHGSPSTSAPATTGSTNIAFFDGHAETVDRRKLPSSGNELTDPTPSTKRLAGHLWPYFRLDEGQ